MKEIKYQGLFERLPNGSLKNIGFSFRVRDKVVLSYHNKTDTIEAVQHLLVRCGKDTIDFIFDEIIEQDDVKGISKGLQLYLFYASIKLHMLIDDNKSRIKPIGQVISSLEVLENGDGPSQKHYDEISNHCEEIAHHYLNRYDTNSKSKTLCLGDKKADVLAEDTIFLQEDWLLKRIVTLALNRKKATKKTMEFENEL